MAEQNITNRSGDRRGLSSITHGESTLLRGRSDEYVIWSNMKQRCCNPNNQAFHNYGGRGIFVCDRWKRSFEAFLEDMRRRPSKKHEIERRDNNRGYSPDNCYWATPIEQGRNKRTNRIITVGLLSMIVTDWAKHSGVSRKTIQTRLSNGWPEERAVTEPSKQSLGSNRYNRAMRDIGPASL